MSPIFLFIIILAYFGVLLGVAYYTSRGSNNQTFFIGNKSSNWMLVAFGMIGTSLSGVTFVSVPGAVPTDAFGYLQITIGYLIGYVVIAYVLLPLYYKLNLTSIYDYLKTRLGFVSYKTGAGFFIVSRTLGATARLYLVVKILQDAILSELGVPFWVTTLVILIMILLYTYEGGVKTIVWTDTLQTAFMLGGLVICTFYILSEMNLNLVEGVHKIGESGLTKVFSFNPESKSYFLKQILAGAFITITMTGMDQEMMQKNISVKTLGDSRKNMLSLSAIMLVVISLFLVLGGMLFVYAQHLGAEQITFTENGKNITRLMLDGKDITGDKLFPAIALHYMSPIVSIVFIIALISALFPSADGAITALTSSFCLDIIGIQRNAELNDAQRQKLRQRVHLSFAAIFLAFVLVFKWIDSASMIGVILKVAGYTYGPLLGLFAFGLLTKRTIKDKLTPFICVIAPVMCYVIDVFQKDITGSFEIGLELLILNGLFTFIGLLIFSKKN